MLLSTFELLVKSQLPKGIPVLPGNKTLLALSRPVVQGYFLTIANITANPAKLILNFKAATTPLAVNIADVTATILDSSGVNDIGDVIPDVANAYKYMLEIQGDQTALFILQPDIITQPNALTDENIELRGYVDVELDPANILETVELLITPEHRGTFYGSGITEATPVEERQLGEIAYSLPTAQGGSYFKLQK
jgi:hypothetical protein